MKALIVDDEQLSHNVIEDLLGNSHHDIDVVASGQNVAEGISLIESHQPDLVFLDIEMPRENGFDLLNKVEEIDFLTGNEPYKQDWMSVRRERWALVFIRDRETRGRGNSFVESLQGQT